MSNIGGDDDPDSPDLRLFITTGWQTTWIDMTPERLVELRDAIDEALRKADRCEHGVECGEYCRRCREEYRKAEQQNA